MGFIMYCDYVHAGCFDLGVSHVEKNIVTRYCKIEWLNVIVKLNVVDFYTGVC